MIRTAWLYIIFYFIFTKTKWEKIAKIKHCVCGRGSNYWIEWSVSAVFGLISNGKIFTIGQL